MSKQVENAIARYHEMYHQFDQAKAQRDRAESELVSAINELGALILDHGESDIDGEFYFGSSTYQVTKISGLPEGALFVICVLRT